MFNSMTGFGSSVRNLRGIGRLELQLRSINHRYLEVVFHAPEEFIYLEDVFRQMLSHQLSRGRVTCALRLDSAPSEVNIFDEARLFAYHRKLCQLNKKLKAESSVGMGLLLSLPGVVASRPKYKDIPQQEIKKLFNEALRKLIQQRKKEGAALYRDLKNRINKLHFYLEKLHARFRHVIATKIKGFALPEEKNNFLRNSDITEELVRIKFHLKNFSQETAKNSASGKELDFIAQELGREANTVGAKSVDALVSGYVIKIKTEIDKIREQLQNVE